MHLISSQWGKYTTYITLYVHFNRLTTLSHSPDKLCMDILFTILCTTQISVYIVDGFWCTLLFFLLRVVAVCLHNILPLCASLSTHRCNQADSLFSVSSVNIWFWLFRNAKLDFITIEHPQFAHTPISIQPNDAPNGQWFEQINNYSTNEIEKKKKMKNDRRAWH